MTRTIWTTETTMTPDAAEGDSPICETCGGCGSRDGQAPAATGYNYCYDCAGSGIVTEDEDGQDERNEASIRY